MDNPLEFIPTYVMKLHAISKKLNNIYVVNLKWQHQWTLDSFFQVHIDFKKEMCIFVKTLERIFIFYVEKYLIVRFHKVCYHVTKRSNLSYYGICDTTIIHPFSHSPNVSY